MFELKMMFLHCFDVMAILLAAVEQVSIMHRPRHRLCANIQVAKFADKYGMF